MRHSTGSTPEAQLQRAFPNLQDFSITSERDTQYNCIAWAAEVSDDIWWPGSSGYWPPTAPTEPTIPAFILAFSTLGYVACADGFLEQGYEKVAIYAKPDAALNLKVSHMARQLPDGRWTSKLGRSEDIEHATPSELDSILYGKVVQYMQRVRETPPA